MQQAKELRFNHFITNIKLALFHPLNTYLKSCAKVLTAI